MKKAAFPSGTPPYLLHSGESRVQWKQTLYVGGSVLTTLATISLVKDLSAPGPKTFSVAFHIFALVAGTAMLAGAGYAHLTEQDTDDDDRPRRRKRKKKRSNNLKSSEPGHFDA